MKKLVAVFGILFALSACAADQAPPPARTSHVLPPKIALDVQAINLADRSGLQPVSSPYNANHFSPTISDAIKQWAGDRLQAAGQSGQAIIVIKDASLIEQPMPIRQGMDGWFTRQQGVKYIGRAEVSIEANGRPGFAMTDAIATRAITLPENPTLVEKQNAYYTMLNELMKDLGQNLETGIQTHMGGFIVTPQVYGVTAVPTGDMYAGAQPGNEAPVIIQSPTGMQGGMQAGRMNNPYAAAAVADAAVPAPQSVAVTPPTLTISQSPSAPALPQVMQQGMAPAPAYASAPPTALYPPTMPSQASSAAITQAQLPPAQSPAPVYGTSAVPTVSDLGSAPSSFGQPPAMPQPPSYAAYAGQQQPQQQPAPLPQPVSDSYGTYAAAAPSPQPSTAAPVTIPLSPPSFGAGYGQ